MDLIKSVSSLNRDSHMGNMDALIPSGGNAHIKVLGWSLYNTCIGFKKVALVPLRVLNFKSSTAGVFGALGMEPKNIHRK